MPDSQAKSKSDLTQKQAETLTPFDTTFCDLKTKCMFESWATVACFRIMAFLQSRKGQGIYSIRGIAFMCHLKKSHVANTLALLIKHNYIVRRGTQYFANNALELSKSADKTVHGKRKSVHISGKSVQFDGHNNQNNNQIITNSFSLTEEEYKKKLERLGLKERELKQ